MARQPERDLPRPPMFEWANHRHVQTLAADVQTGIADEYVRLYAPFFPYTFRVSQKYIPPPPYLSDVVMNGL